MTAEILTESELKELTGTESHAHQARVLRENGIFYVAGIGGRVRTTWYHVNHPASMRKSDSAEAEPDWGAMENA